MRFDVVEGDFVAVFDLVYRSMDYSFDVDPKPQGGGSSVVVNDLQLEVAEDGRVMYVWGLCPHTSWTKDALRPPQAHKAILLARPPGNATPGVSMRINRERWPVLVDQKHGWVKIAAPSDSVEGNKQALGEKVYVEFAPGTIAGLLDSHLRELWLRPLELPGDWRQQL